MAEPRPMPDPEPGIVFFSHEMPTLPVSMPTYARPSDADFTLRQADNFFANGKRAFQENRFADARKDFDRAVQALLAAPSSLTDRSRIEARLDELIEAIYKYDLDAQTGGDGAVEEASTKRPLDEILELTFPVDPSTRTKVRKQVESTGSGLPLEQTDAVLSYVNYFSSPRGRQQLQYGLYHSGRYRDLILKTLAEEGIPQELIFLAQAESAFSPRAVSWAKCVGIWQFETFTGRRYNLTQSSLTEDRMDPDLSTRAAAHLLKDLYNHFGDWYLAMAAYNCGQGCVDSAIQRTGYADFWTLRRLNAIPRETQNYVPAIVGMTIVAKNAAEYGIEVDYQAPLEYDTVEVPTLTHLGLVAAAIDRTMAELRELNPALTRSLAPAHYSVHIPKGSGEQLQAAFRVIPVEQRGSWRIHKVEYGDTLASVAKRYGVAPTVLASINNGELPEAGSFAAVPSGYAGEVVKKPVIAQRAAAPTQAAPSRRYVPKVAPRAKAPVAKSGPPVARGKSPTRRPRG